jgi:hypothetical protein
MKDTLRTNSLSLAVFSPQVDTTAAFKDIKPLINTPLNFAEIKPYLAQAVAVYVLAALVTALLWILLNRKKIINILRPTLPPHIKALQDLGRLKSDKLWLKTEVKEYFTRLTDIIRIYLEERFEIRAMESTSAEIMAQYKQHAYHDQEEETGILYDLLELSDLVKFAKADPPAAEKEMCLNNAMMFVQLTRPQEPVAPAGGEKSEKDQPLPGETETGTVDADEDKKNNLPEK